MQSEIRGNRLHDLYRLGQSIWLDELQRGLLVGPGLKNLIADDAVTGLTSNPSIFAKAFATDPHYKDAIHRMRIRGLSGQQIYETLSSEDIGTAADQLLSIYEQTDKRDGYVSIEVPPAIAHDANLTIGEALRLSTHFNRPNVMIKIPATDAGVRALRPLIANGVNVNATLVFGVQRYRELLEAYLLGLEDRVERGDRVDGIGCVVSLFVSRLDTLVDQRLAALQNSDRSVSAQAHIGKTAVAVARLAYQEYKNSIASHRWQALLARHAMPQRLLWASTSTKNPAFSDTKYVDELIGLDTVNTMPMKTLEAFRDHGAPVPTLAADPIAISSLPGELQTLGIDLDAVAAQLEKEGLDAFAKSMNEMLASLGGDNAAT